jgi:hypothetical protein
MIASVTVPVSVPPDVAELIAARGYQAQFEQFVAKACELIPEVRRIETRLSHSDTGDFEDGVTLLVLRNGRPPVPDPAQQEYSKWELATFPPEVWLTFSLVVVPEVGHGR